MPWLSTSKSSMGSTIHKNMLNVIYPIFMKFSEHVDDPYWKSILINCAKGKFPKGFIYNDNILLYRPNGESVNIDDTGESINIFIDFIRSNAKIRSKMDLDREKDYEKEQQIGKNVKFEEWGKIKSKFNKRLLIIEYVTKMKNLYDLSQDESDQLTTLINMNMNEEIIKRNIIIQDNNISGINGLQWDPISRKFYLEGENRKVNTPKSNACNYHIIYVEEEIPLEHKRFETTKDWNKFIKEFTKVIKKTPSLKEEKIHSSPINSSDVESYNRSSNS